MVTIGISENLLEMLRLANTLSLSLADK